MPFAKVQIQATPNPNAVKFVLDKPISESPLSFFNAQAAQGHPLAGALFKIPGVSSLLLLGDFITVNKQPDASWKSIKDQVLKTLKNQP